MTGAAGISTNRALITARAGTSGYYLETLETSVANHRIDAKLGATANLRHAIVLSLLDGQNFLYVFANNGVGLTVAKRIANTLTTIATPAVTITSASVISAWVIGTSLHVAVDGVEVHNSTVSDRPAGTKIGFGIGSSAAYDGYWDEITGSAA